MRKAFWIIPVALFMAVAASFAHADTFSGSFDCVTGCTNPIPTSDSTFTSDPSSQWEITFVYSEFSIAAPENISSTFLTDEWTYNIYWIPFFNLEFLTLYDQSAAASYPTIASNYFETPFNQSGTINFTDLTPTPEPATGGLILVGTVMIGLGLRRRFPRGVLPLT